MSWFKKSQNWTREKKPSVRNCSEEIGIQPDVWDSHGGESFCTITAYLMESKIVVGRIDYNYIHDTGNAWIKWIEVVPECRFKGIGRMMVEALKAEIEGEIEWSNSTPEGAMFRNRVDPSVP